MKFGCFGTVKQLEDIANAGFDSAELDFCEIAAMDDATFTSFADKASKSRLSFEVFSGLIPLNIRFQSATFNLTECISNIRTGAKRVKSLGCQMIPFGAGKCRSIPENCNKDSAKKVVAKVISEIASTLSEYDILLVIEPLGPAYSNYLQTFPDVQFFLDELSNENCQSMCDLRHMIASNEDYNDIIRYSSIIKHAHIDYPKGEFRYFPSPSDDFNYKPYLESLYKAKYQGIITVEATAIKNNFLSEATNACNFLRNMWHDITF